jgi:hypothetical protein
MAKPNSLKVGDYVSWGYTAPNGESYRVRGRIIKIAKNSTVNVPDTNIVMKGTPDDPVALIRKYDDVDSKWKPSDTVVGHRFSDLTKISALEAAVSKFATYKDIDFRPPKGAREEAERGLKWVKEGHGGSALMPQTVERARTMAKGQPRSPDTVRRMKGFFARHPNWPETKGFKPGEDGYPNPARVSWALWGGDPGYSWAKKVVDLMDRREQDGSVVLTWSVSTASNARRV